MSAGRSRPPRGRPRSTAVAAHSEVRLLRIDGATVMELLREFPDLAIEVIRVLAARLERTNAQARGARGEA